MKTDLPVSFKEGVHVQLLIDRGVNNANRSSERWVNRLISTNPEEYDKNMEILVGQQKYIGNKDVRLYSTLNPRKMGKAVNILKHKLIDVTDEMDFYKRLNDRFVSCLMHKGCRDRKYYMVDIDSKDVDIFQAVNNHIKELEAPSPIFSYPTPNGFHLIMAPFDVSIIAMINFHLFGVCLLKTIEVKTDSLVLLHTID